MNIANILLVEDNPGDAFLVKDAIESSKILCNLDHVVDGVEAMAFLRKEGEYADAPKPHLVLLDLNLPRKNGQEVLAEIREDPELHRTPVVILTGSQAESDIVKSYDLKANAYVTKPVELEGFAKIVKGIEGFWLGIVTFPDRE